MKFKYTVVILVFLTLYAHAHSICIDVSQVNAPAGSEITVAINVADATGIAGGDITLDYDGSIFAIKEARTTALTQSFNMAWNTSTEGGLKLSMARATGLKTGSGPILLVDFEVKAGISGKEAFVLSKVVLFDEVGNDIPTEVTLCIMPIGTFDLKLNAGLNLISIPLADATVKGATEPIRKVKDFGQALGDTWSLIVVVNIDGNFRSYTPATPDSARSNIDIRCDTGLIVVMKQTRTLKLRGKGWEPCAISLGPGINLIGLPLRDNSLEQVSDLAARLGGSVSLIISLTNGQFQSFIPGSTPIGAPVDIMMHCGLGLILSMKSAASISITGETCGN